MVEAIVALVPVSMNTYCEIEKNKLSNDVSSGVHHVVDDMKEAHAELTTI